MSYIKTHMKTLKHLEMFESDKVATWKAVYFAFINMSAKAKNLMEQTLELNEAENLLQEVRNYFVIREHEATKHITNLRTMDSIMDLLKKILALKTDHYNLGQKLLHTRNLDCILPLLFSMMRSCCRWCTFCGSLYDTQFLKKSI